MIIKPKIITGCLVTIFVIIVFVFMIPRDTWNYEYSSINGYGTLAFYEPDIFFIFSEKHSSIETGQIIHSGCFPISGKSFTGNTLECYSDNNGSISTFSFSFSPFTGKGTWRINGHTIELSNAGKKIILDGQVIDWDKGSLTIVVVNANNIHLCKSIPKKDVILDKINNESNNYICPLTILPQDNVESNGQTDEMRE